MIDAQTLHRAISRMVAPIQRQVRLVVTRAVVRAITDAAATQRLQVGLLSDELRDDVEHFQEYGFVSVPLAGAEGLFLTVCGNRDHGVVIAVGDKRYRPQTLSPGDVAMYSKTAGIMARIEDATGVLNLGASSAAQFVAQAQKTDDNFDTLRGWIDDIIAAITGAVPGVMDGGAALKASIISALPVTSNPPSVAATKVKAT
jgi:phage baseplate assembly protein V